MPRITPALERCNFFAVDPRTKEPIGSGFFLGIESRVPGHTHLYAVTNRHVCQDACGYWIKLNRLEGSTRFMELDGLDWVFNGAGPDLAIADITDDFEVEGGTLAYIDIAFCVQPETIAEHDIGIGDDTIMMGLYDLHPDQDDRIRPVGRFGHIALMADPAVKLRTRSDRTPRPYHLVDTRSRGGFSGAPVFAWRVPTSTLNSVQDGKFSPNLERDTFLILLGIHCGQFWEESEFETKPRGAPAEAIGRPVLDTDKLSLPGGMTMVLPAHHIRELFLHPKLHELRLARDAVWFEQDKNLPRAEVAQRDHPSLNPQHKEDFMALLGAAAKRPPQSD